MAENIFDNLAKKYDAQNRIDLAEIIIAEVKKELEGHHYNSLLDYGGGTGLVSLELADQFDSVLIADASSEMVKAAESKISGSGMGHVETLHLDLTKDDTAPGADVILVSLVLLHVPDTAGLLKQLYRILNDGGKLIIVDFDKHPGISHPKVHNGFTHEKIQAGLEKVGFNAVSVRTFHQGKGIFMKQDASMFLADGTK